MVEKKKVKWDGVEIPGLVSVSEITREKRTVEVPFFDKIVDVQSNITKMPQITFVYKIERGRNTLEYFETFFAKNEVHDCEIIRTDAHGVEFNRKVYQDTEVMSDVEPSYDAASPDYAKVTFTVTVNDIVTTA